MQREHPFVNLVYFPLYTGFLFSTKAFNPSILSSLSTILEYNILSIFNPIKLSLETFL